jgi:hypothetical protein
VVVHGASKSPYLFDWYTGGGGGVRRPGHVRAHAAGPALTHARRRAPQDDRRQGAIAAPVGLAVLGASEGTPVGLAVLGASEGTALGACEGDALGASEGDTAQSIRRPSNHPQEQNSCTNSIDKGVS